MLKCWFKINKTCQLDLLCLITRVKKEISTLEKGAFHVFQEKVWQYDEAEELYIHIWYRGRIWWTFEDIPKPYIVILESDAEY